MADSEISLNTENLGIENLPNVRRVTLVEGEGQDSVDFYFNRGAFHMMAKHLSVDSVDITGYKEAAGVFFGVHGTTNGRKWTRIDHYYPLDLDYLTPRTRGSVTFSTEAIGEAQHRVDKRYPNENYVVEGTAHSHPKFGTFLSEQDKTITQCWPNEWNFAVVYDPYKDELAIFSPGGGAQAGDKQKKVIWEYGLKVTDEIVKEVATKGSPQELGIGENYQPLGLNSF